MSNINQAKITELLAVKHSQDVFVPQCKTGPSMTGLGIFDAWTFNRSWANLNCCGYEIKTSRRDFLGDTKWPKYLPYCHSFYFVCPSGLIKPEECPENAGLLYVSKTGSRLFTKVRAKRRDIEIPIEILMYVLMARTVITEDHYMTKPNKRFWEEWLKNKELDKIYGLRLSKRIRDRVDSEIVAVRKENKKLKEDGEKVVEFKESAAKLGIDFDAWNVDRELKEKQKEFETGIKQELLDSVKALDRDINYFYKRIGVEREQNKD